MTTNGKKIKEFLDNFQKESAVGCEQGHMYTSNGTISCVKCGKIRS